MDKKKLAVVFAGAGFPKAFGLPLTAELWGLGQTKAKLADTAGLGWRELIAWPIMVENMRRNDGEVERLLNEWEADIERNERNVGTDDSLSSGRMYRDHYVTNLIMHLEEFTDKVCPQKQAQQFAMWCRKALAAYNLAFITTNYDRSIERMLKLVGMDFTYTGSYPRVPIRKPHGSVNWLGFDNFLGGGQVFREKDGWSPERIGTLGDSAISDFHLEPISWSGGEIPPTIIPPTLNKHYAGVFTQQFADSDSLIRSADRVMFVGYSFPPADKALGDFIQKAIQKSSCKRFFCVNGDADVQARAAAVTKGREFRSIKENWSMQHFEDFLL